MSDYNVVYVNNASLPLNLLTIITGSIFHGEYVSRTVFICITRDIQS